MKTVVKLDTTRAIEVKPDGKWVAVNGLTFGLIGISFKLTPDQAATLGDALTRSAHLAESVRLALEA